MGDSLRLQRPRVPPKGRRGRVLFASSCAEPGPRRHSSSALAPGGQLPRMYSLPRWIAAHRFDGYDLRTSKALRSGPSGGRNKRSICSTGEEETVRNIQRPNVSAGGPHEQDDLPLAGGRLLAEITNRIVALMREHYGRGPIKAKTYVLDNLIVCVLSDGFTAIERTMMEGGERDQVLELRRGFQRVMKERYSKMIETLTGRKVLAFLSQAHVEPDLTIEMFLMDGPVPGFGALELVEPPPPEVGEPGP